MVGGLPSWARRIRTERQARGLSQAGAVRLLRAHCDKELPSDEALIRQWKEWESGRRLPGDFYQPLIAAMFGTVRYAIFPVPHRRDPDPDLVAVAGMSSLDLVTRVRGSDVDDPTIEALTVTVDRLCSEYAHVPTDHLAMDGREWLSRIADLRHRRLSLAQHREGLALAGWLALLVGCVEYDAGRTCAAEATRQAALSLGREAGLDHIVAWAHEMAAWFALTAGDYHRVLHAAEAGRSVATGHGVAAQLHAQRAKALARLGERRQVEVALDEGRRALDALPYPANPTNHFVVDPKKFDYYAMDVYRRIGVDHHAEALAEDVLATTGDDAPMRLAEARITLGVIAVRRGDLESAVYHGNQALAGDKKSLPSLRMVAQELTDALQAEHPDESLTITFLEQLEQVSSDR